MSVIRRGRTFDLRRRVPRRYRGVEARGTVWISLHIDSEAVARGKADRAWGQMVEASEVRHAAALELARVRGFRYLDVGPVAKLPVAEPVARVEAT